MQNFCVVEGSAEEERLEPGARQRFIYIFLPLQHQDAHVRELLYD